MTKAPEDIFGKSAYYNIRWSYEFGKLMADRVHRIASENNKYFVDWSLLDDDERSAVFDRENLA